MRCALPLALLTAWAAGHRPIRYADLPLPARQTLDVSEATFPGLLRSLDRSTADRLAQGENDHLIFFILQSRSFTRYPPIEPALSAAEFFRDPGRNLAEAVTARLRDFHAAFAQPAADERLRYFQRHLKPPSLDVLRSAYEQAMRFLHEKEFTPGGSSLYQQRGHSSDTQIEANFAPWNALGVVKTLEPAARLDRTLIVGPGLHFAPRTDFFELLPPQSYQPFALADALLALRLAHPDHLRVHCVDINPRVVAWLEEFRRRRQPRLTLLTRHQDPLFLEYFRGLGRAVARESPLSRLPPHYVGKSLLLRKSIAQAVTAKELNIVTQRLDPSPGYDLALTTNVFLYFSNAELLLALANIHAMLRPGGYLIHNELRLEAESYARLLDLEPVQVRSLRLTAEGQPPLFDNFVIHRKRP